MPLISTIKGKLRDSRHQKKGDEAAKSAASSSKHLPAQPPIAQIPGRAVSAASKPNIDEWTDLWSEGQDLQFDSQLVQDIVEKLLQDQEKKRWQFSIQGNNIVLYNQIEKLGRFLIWSDSLVKQAVNADPYAALAWSGVSLLVPLLSSSFKQREAMLDGFSTICEVQEFWKTWQDGRSGKLQENNYLGLHGSLLKLYSFVIEYQARVICFLSRSQLARAWDKVADSNDWKTQRSNIQSIDNRCKEFVNFQHQREIQECMGQSNVIVGEILKHMERDYEERWEQELMKNLRSQAGRYEHDKDGNPNKVAGTCDWFLAEPMFCNWRDSKSSSVLWVTAGPGCGKSVLSKSLIDDAQLPNGITVEVKDSPSASRILPLRVCYFFFKDGDSLRINHTNALCAILFQLLSGPSGEELRGNAASSHRIFGEDLATNFAELWRVLMACATSPSVGGIFCVLDALDECRIECRNELWCALQNFHGGEKGTESSKIKFLVTSRPSLDLKDRSQALCYHLELDDDERLAKVRRDIDLVIESNVESLPRIKEEDRREISKYLRSMDNRTYLWIYLTWDIIKKEPSVYSKRSGIESLLRKVPPTLDDAYEKLLSRSPNKRMTKALLQLVLAASRPLTLTEANIALTLATTSIKQEDLTYDLLLEDLWQEDFESVVKDMCGLFISVHESTLSFIHQTAREFLTVSTESETEWKGRFGMASAHGVVFSCCIRYLTLLADTQDPGLEVGLSFPQNLKVATLLGLEYSFIDYAVRNWYNHFDSQGAHISHEDLQNAKAMFQHPRRISWWPWPFLMNPQLNIISETYDADYLTELQLATYFTCYQVVKMILESSEEEVDKALIYMPALHIAASQGRLDGIELLLSHNANINSQDESGSTALMEASKHGQLEAVRLLLSKGAKIDVFGGSDGTALGAASRNGHKEVVDVLLSHNAATDNYTRLFETPLSAAAGGDHRDIVETLLPLTCVDSLSLIFFTIALQHALRSVSEAALKPLLAFLDKLNPSQAYYDKLALWATFNVGGWLTMMGAIQPRNFERAPTKRRGELWALEGGEKYLLEILRNNISVGESMIKASIRRPLAAPKVMNILLDKCNIKSIVSKDMIELAACRGTKETMISLLDRCEIPDVIIDATRLLVLAAENSKGAAIIHLLLDKYDYNIQTAAKAVARVERGGYLVYDFLEKHKNEIVVTEEILKVAARNHSSNSFHLFWNHDNQFEMTAELLQTIAKCKITRENRLWHVILQSDSNRFSITEDMLRAASASASLEQLKLLLDRPGGRAAISEKALIAASRHDELGFEKLRLLLEHCEEGFPITAALLKAAAANSQVGGKIFNHLCQHYLGGITVTEAVLKIAAANPEGHRIFEALIDRYNDQLPITGKVVKTAATSGYLKVLDLFRQRRLGSVTDEWYNVARFWNAVRCSDLPIIQKLLCEGLSPHARNRERQTPLEAAIEGGKWKVVELLAQRPDLDVNTLSEDASSLVKRAVKRIFLIGQSFDPAENHKRSLAILLKTGAILSPEVKETIFWDYFLP